MIYFSLSCARITDIPQQDTRCTASGYPLPSVQTPVALRLAAKHNTTGYPPQACGKAYLHKYTYRSIKKCGISRHCEVPQTHMSA